MPKVIQKFSRKECICKPIFVLKMSHRLPILGAICKKPDQNSFFGRKIIQISNLVKKWPLFLLRLNFTYFITHLKAIYCQNNANFGVSRPSDWLNLTKKTYPIDTFLSRASEYDLDENNFCDAFFVCFWSLPLRAFLPLKEVF